MIELWGYYYQVSVKKMSIPKEELDKYFEGVLIFSVMRSHVSKNQEKIVTKHNVDVEKSYSEDHDKNNVGQMLWREYQILHTELRFSMLKDYIRQFTQKNINSFDDLLQYGRESLLYQYNNAAKHHATYDEKYDFFIDSGTAIEPSLYREDWPILQMIELNKYMFTHASTNYPTDDNFQEMFVDGYIRRDIVELLEEELKKHTDLTYTIDLIPRYYQPSGLETKEWTNQICDLSIEYTDIKKRDLYLRVIEIFQNVYEKLYTIQNKNYTIA